MIHKTAVIHPASRIADDVQIGPFAVVEEDVEVDSGCRIAAHAVIKRGVRMGRDNRVFEHAVLGGEPQDLKFKGGASGVSIGDRNIFREGVTVNRCTEPGALTRIGSDCFFMTCSHVAHECVIGDFVMMANCVALAGHVTIEDRAFLSGGVVVHQFTTVGRLAMVGGNAKVIQDVPPFCLADGVPARVRSLNLVGLRRAGFDPQEIRRLKKAFRLLAGPGHLRGEKIPRLKEIDSPAVRHWVEFIEKSQRGLASFA